MQTPNPYLCAALTLVAAQTTCAQFAEPDVSVLYTLIGEVTGDQFGFVTSEVADIDGDGASEIIVGAPGHDAAGTRSGRTYVYSGRTGDLILGLVWTGTTATENLGAAVDSAGDVNGDDTTDLIIGAPGAPFGTSTLPGRVIVCSGKDGSIIWERSGDNPGDHFGIDVAGIQADVDGDGLDDVLVSADLYNTPTITNAGRVYVLSGADGSVITTIDGTSTNANLGNGVGRIGDVNDDGEVEIVAAARNSGRSPKGRAFVYTAKTGDLVHTLVPNATAASFGWFFTTGVGDVDGDKIPDVYVPDFGDYALGSATGRAYVFSGATGEKIREWQGEMASEGFGIGRGAGDVDHDGCEDMLLCSWTSSLGASNAGKAYVYSGRDSSLIRSMTCTIAGDTVGYDANPMGDVNSDGEIDFALTAPSRGPGRIYVVAGNPDFCYPDCDKSTGAGVLDIFDFLCFQNSFVISEPYACDCDTSTGLSVCDIFDFLCFQNAFVAGCP